MLVAAVICLLICMLTYHLLCTLYCVYISYTYKHDDSGIIRNRILQLSVFRLPKIKWRNYNVMAEGQMFDCAILFIYPYLYESRCYALCKNVCYWTFRRSVYMNSQNWIAISMPIIYLYFITVSDDERFKLRCYNSNCTKY